MKYRTTSRLFLSLTVGALLSSSAAALADEVETRRTIINNDGTQTETTTTSSTASSPNLVSGISVSVEPSTMLTVVGTRRALLEQTLADEINKGRISAIQAASLRAQLDRDRAHEALIRSRVTYYNVLPVAVDLDAVSTRLKTYVNTFEYQPLVTNQGFYISTDKYFVLDDFMKRRIDLENKIANALLVGQLTGAQATDLRDSLDALAVKEANLRASQGGISDHNAKSLYTDYDRVGSRVDHLISSSGVHIREVN